VVLITLNVIHRLVNRNFLTEPLSSEAESNERWWNGEVVYDRVDVDPTDQLVIGSNQLKTDNEHKYYCESNPSAVRRFERAHHIDSVP